MVRVQLSLVIILSFCSSSSAPSSIHEPVGSNATLNCKYPISPLVGYYDIEWMKRFSNIRDQDRPIIWFTNGQLYADLDQEMKGRVSFKSRDPRNSDASIIIRDLRPSDSGTYVCSVQKSSEIAKKRVLLTVVEELSKPVCTVEGDPTEGKNVTLKCRSNDALVTPLKFTWKKMNGNRMSPPKAYVDTKEGDLFVKKITNDDYGQYRCTVIGPSSSKSCLVLLKNPDAELIVEVESLPPDAPSNGDPVTVAAVTSVVILLAVVCAVVFVCYWRRRNRMYFPNEMEDVVPPVSN
nr:coxsackievirus and adenovirus receptor homolog isoform X1 [Doryrhamphus excisus]XP_057928749.1 coxsackievirus and adenovirus receptor homolog isoform X1 [Doryrhamphus excisus]